MEIKILTVGEKCPFALLTLYLLHVRGYNVGMDTYTEDMAKTICDRLATSTDGLKTICKGEGMPCHVTVLNWLRDHPEFREMYNNAKTTQMDLLAEECLEIAASADIGDWQVAKLHIDTVKWITSKLAPKRYGDKVTHSSDPDAPLVTNPTADAIIAFLLAKGATEHEIRQFITDGGKTIEHEATSDIQTIK